MENNIFLVWNREPDGTPSPKGIPPGNFEQINLVSRFEFRASLRLKYVVNKR